MLIGLKINLFYGEIKYIFFKKIFQRPQKYTNQKYNYYNRCNLCHDFDIS